MSGTRRGRRRSAVAWRVVLALWTFATVAASDTDAKSLVDVFNDPRFARLGLAPLGPALADTVASTYPIGSASSSVVYQYNPALETLERRPGLLGPILGERAETIGAGGIDLAATYSFVDLTTINGHPLDHLVNRPVVNGQFLFFPVPGGVTLKDGRVTTLLPVHVTLDLGVEAQIIAPSVTYGVTPDLDVNLTVPIVRTSLQIDAATRVPDPRFPEFALPAGAPEAEQGVLAASADSVGIGDILLRSKYVVHRGFPVDLAVGLGLALPSGRRENFQGTGTTRVSPSVIASRTLGDRFELLANAGADLVVDDVDRSVIRWAIGGTVNLVDTVAIPLVFLGRHEFVAPADPIPVPFFFQIQRSDVVDASIGFRWQFAGAATLSMNALVPLNRGGLRADVIPTGVFEYTF